MSGPSPFLEKDNKTVANCRQCESPMPDASRLKLYCSPKCADRWRYLNTVKPGKHGARSCVECGTAFVGSTSQRKYCSPDCFDLARRRSQAGLSVSARTFGEASCAFCAQGFVRRTVNAKYCGHTCQKRAGHARRMTDGTYERQRSIQRRPEYGTPCTDCGKPLVRFRSEVPRCRECGLAAKQRTAAALARRKRAEQRLATAEAGTAGRFPFVAGQCGVCGDWFVHHQLSTPAGLYCARHRRRVTKRRGFSIGKTARLRTYERDDWTCQICGDPVNREARVPELDAPTIDHRLPLAVGGAHAEANWQTAHFYCNSTKRDQVGFEFALAEVAA